MSDAKRIVKAADLILQYGGIDGDHHKQWVLDQVLRTLLTVKEYKKWTELYRGDLNDEAEYDYDEWDVGIPP